MHELSICQSMIQQVTVVAQHHHARAVHSIRVSIGPLSGVEPSLLQQAFPLASVGTIAQDAELVVDNAPVRVRCRRCGVEGEARPNRLVCAHCGDWQTQLLSGDELLLASVELST